MTRWNKPHSISHRMNRVIYKDQNSSQPPELKFKLTEVAKRLKEQEIDMSYCGIDLASKSSAICVLSSNGNRILETSCPTDAVGFSEALEGRGRLKCVVEASPLSEWVAQLLESLGHEVVVIDPRRAKAIISAKRKTDVLDARNLAKMAHTGWYTEVHRKSGEARLLRSYHKARQGLSASLQAQESRIRGLLRAHGIKLGVVSIGQFESKVRRLVELDGQGLGPVLEGLLRVRVVLREELKQSLKQIRQLARQDEVCQMLMSVPGVGPVVSSAYVATIDDPRRFARGDQVASYVGLTPSIHQSGEVEYRGRITKEGDQLLRWLLVEAAHVLLTRSQMDHPLKRWGLKLAAQKGSAKAKVAVARKLAILLHRLWLNGERFEPTHCTV